MGSRLTNSITQYSKREFTDRFFNAIKLLEKLKKSQLGEWNLIRWEFIGFFGSKAYKYNFNQKSMVVKIQSKEFQT